MAQKTIGNNWDRKTRNDLNAMLTDLYKKYNEFTQAVIEEIRDELLEGSKISFIDPVKTKGDLPKSAEIGDTAFASEEGTWYRWDGSEWDAVAKTDPSEFVSLQEEIKKVSDSLSQEIEELRSIKRVVVSKDEPGDADIWFEVQ